MGFFDKLASAAVGIVVSPIDVVKDVVTMGGSLTDRTLHRKSSQTGC